MAADSPDKNHTLVFFQMSWKALLAFTAVILAMDPLCISLVRQYPNFEAHYVEPQSFISAMPEIGNKSSSWAPHFKFQGEFLGPESIAFDEQGRPYTGISDGRIIRWEGEDRGWKTFAVTSQNRTGGCAPRRPPIANVRYEHICGRPLGLRFHKITGELYIADAYMGLMVVGPEGGLARLVVNEVDSRRLKFTNDVDFDYEQGHIYFTDTSTKYQRRQYIVSILESDNTGRLLRYDPVSKTTRVIRDGLRFPNGVAVSRGGEFILVAESLTGRLLRYWLKGPNVSTWDVFAVLPGNPDNVRVNDRGEFWVAMYSRSKRLEYLAAHPRLKTLLLRIPVSLRFTFRFFSGSSHGMLARYNSRGEILEILEDSVKHVSEVEERPDGTLWLGSVTLSHISVLKLQEP